MGTTASYPVNQLMQELFTNPGNVELFRADREALYERYGLSSAQRAALDEGGFGALTAVGLHPVLQMHHFMLTNPMAPDFVSIKAYRKMVDRNG